jgi:HECT-domain (ubiquitin-transferase)
MLQLVVSLRNVVDRSTEFKSVFCVWPIVFRMWNVVSDDLFLFVLSSATTLCACDLLGELFSLSRIFSVPASTFYSQTASTHFYPPAGFQDTRWDVGIDREVTEWESAIEREAGWQSEMLAQQSFLRFPFLLDLTAKRLVFLVISRACQRKARGASLSAQVSVPFSRTPPLVQRDLSLGWASPTKSSSASSRGLLPQGVQAGVPAVVPSTPTWTSALSPPGAHLILRLSRDADSLVRESLSQLLGWKELYQTQVGEEVNPLLLPLEVHFDGEDGHDVGGITREFIQLVCGELFSSRRGLFAGTTGGLFFNSASSRPTAEYWLAGVAVGFSLLHSVLLNDDHGRLVSCVFRALRDGGTQRLEVTLGDLAEVDPVLGRSMNEIAEFEGSPEDWDETFDLFWQATDRRLGRRVVVSLDDQSRHRRVEFSERGLFVARFVRWQLVTRVERSFSAFCEGFSEVIDGRMLDMLAVEELEELCLGSELPPNCSELRETANYLGELTSSDPVIVWFWHIVAGFAPQQHVEFLRFCTGSPRFPVGGPGAVRLQFVLGEPRDDLVPTAATCFPRLILPRYSSEDALKRKLLVALEHSAGFGLV